MLKIRKKMKENVELVVKCQMVFNIFCIYLQTE